jgi:hypothetical protein
MEVREKGESLVGRLADADGSSTKSTQRVRSLLTGKHSHDQKNEQRVSPLQGMIDHGKPVQPPHGMQSPCSCRLPRHTRTAESHAQAEITLAQASSPPVAHHGIDGEQIVEGHQQSMTVTPTV